MKLNFQSAQCWIIKLEKIQLKIRHKKQIEFTQVNLLSIILELWGRNNIIESKKIYINHEI
jgi:hypothetical protein